MKKNPALQDSSPAAQFPMKEKEAPVHPALLSVSNIFRVLDVFQKL